MTTALYGGSFNPPHLVHQLIVMAVLETAAVEALWLLPSARHPFGKSLAPFADRVAWCRALLEPFGARADVCTIENERPDVSYTIDTLEELARRYPERAFSLVLGSDQRAEAPRWRRFEEIVRRFPIHWIGRAGHDPLGEELVMPDVSSTEVRRRLAAGLSVETWVPKRVREAIRVSGYRFAEMAGGDGDGRNPQQKT